MESQRKPVNYYEIESNIQLAVNNGRIIRLVSYAMSRDVEKKMHSVISGILSKYAREDLQGLVYTCLKELAINGTKANLKRIYFEEHGYDLQDEAEYEAGVREYRKIFSEADALIYGKKAFEKGLFVRISFIHDETGLRFEVMNNTAMTVQEERRLRDKLSKIMKYDNMIEFYSENADSTEGAGMGLALITTMLRSQNIDPNSFRILQRDGMTVARLEIPFSQEYVPVRATPQQIS